MKAESPLPLLLVSNAEHDQRLSPPQNTRHTKSIKALLALFFCCPTAQTQKTILNPPPPVPFMREREREKAADGFGTRTLSL